ncbi:MAG: diaminopimelate epimerase [Acidobacteriota bacterium]|nr:diaminopimelate epimerase [Acidobacteriota bacterium]
MPAIPFVKADACGNDFLLIDGMHMPPDLIVFAKKICDRHSGVGADGVEWLLPDQEATVRARLFNADGSEAEISGNGTRCVAAHWVAEHRASEHDAGDALTVRTGAGIKRCRLTTHEANIYWFEMDMGEPQVGDEFPIKLAFAEVRGIPVSMGNPHFVVFVPEFAPGWQAEAAEIGKHHDFKYGINVELVRAGKPDTIEMRIFERGVGETRSSGTGSCAAAVAAIHTKRATSPVKVIAPGGVQTVRWEGQSVFLNGPAQLVCRGEFFI